MPQKELDVEKKELTEEERILLEEKRKAEKEAQEKFEKKLDVLDVEKEIKKQNKGRIGRQQCACDRSCWEL